MNTLVGARPALRAEAIRVVYGAVCGVRDVSFAVDPGEVLGLVGPNGAGKTTIIRAITGRTRLASGTVHIEPGSTAHPVGVAPQKAALHERLTGLENLTLIARHFGVPPSEAMSQAVAALAQVGGSEFGAIEVRKLSGGQRQRINIAAAIVHRPSLVVLDEPAAGLDPAAIADLNRLIRKLAGEGFAIILVTHDMHQAEEVCDRLGVVSGGQLIFCDTPAALRACGGAQGVEAEIEIAGDQGADALEAHGFRRTAGNLWHGRLADHAALGRFTAQLQDEGASVERVTARKDGLRHAVERLIAGSSAK